MSGTLGSSAMGAAAIRPRGHGLITKLIYVGVVVVVGSIGGGVIYLASQDMPPPTERVEKVIPKSRYIDK